MKWYSRCCSILVTASLMMGILVPQGAFAIEETTSNSASRADGDARALPLDSEEDAQVSYGDEANEALESTGDIALSDVQAPSSSEMGPKESDDAFSLDASPTTAPQIIIDVNEEQTFATITVDDPDLEQARRVELPTWSAVNSQDDIIWYRASQNPDRTWSAQVDLTRHHSVGTFYVHLYAEVAGKFGMHGAESFVVEAPKAKVDLVQSEDQKKRGLFDIAISDVISKTPITRVQVPTWSVANNQDDIVWYDATPVADGYVVKDVSCIGAHRAPGLYISHLYVTLKNNAVVFSGAATKTIEVPNTSITAQLDAEKAHIVITAQGGLFDLASSVQFPTWSAARSQDDLVWYASSSKTGGAWTVSVPLSAHRDAGDYYIHSYIWVGGVQLFAAATSVTVPKPTCDVALVQDTAALAVTQKETGRFDIEISNLNAPSDITRVQVPTWSSANDQDDIVWYDAVKDGSLWVVRNVSCVSPRRSPGTYISHVYVTCKNGIFAFAGGAQGNVAVADPSIQITNVNNTESVFDVILKGGVFAGASAVSVPTWSVRNGQDDIVWHQANRQADGSWKASINISRHRDAGTYCVHTYAVVNGSQVFGQATGSFTVTAPTAAVSAQTDDTAGTITVTVSNLSSPSGIKRVQVPTWTTANNQDDIIWHDAYKQDDGSYVATIKAAEHNGEEGPYLSHVYVTCGNDVMAMVGASTNSLTLENFIFVTGNMGSGVRYVHIKNPTVAGQVQMPTWTSENGQDDIVWYNATNLGNGLWRSQIACKRFRHTGNVTTHIYAGGTMIGATSFAVNDADVWTISGDPVLDSYLHQIINERGCDLRSLYNYVMSYPYISGSKYPTGEWTIPFAKEMYQRHGGNCYRYASLFCWLARAAGYDANAISGQLLGSAGGWMAHGWVEIYIDGVTYVCDPQLNWRYPSRNLYMRTYANAPVNYRK